jgi:acyl CoA:acetate/3-ketoacid CoA transferase alpha subunit
VTETVGVKKVASGKFFGEFFGQAFLLFLSPRADAAVIFGYFF